MVQFEKNRGLTSLAVSCYPRSMSDKHGHQKRPRDINLRAVSTVALATGEIVESTPEVTQIPESTPEERHAAAVTLGKKGGKARASKLTAEQRREIAKKAAQARWQKRQQP